MAIEVMMAAYNNVEFTRASLEGYLRQSHPDFSLTVADDGSDNSMRNLVDQYREKINIRHVWHEDKGFRKALLLNKCIATSDADYIIFVDNDCIPHRHFIKDHATHAMTHHCVTGRRVNLGPDISSNIIQNPEDVKHLESLPGLIKLILQNKVADGGRGFYLPNRLSNILNRKKRGLLGSNMAIWRRDLLEINGFDSSFTGYGYEESDLEWRLKANGVLIQSLIGHAIQYHIYHERKSPTRTNLEQMNINMRNNKTFASHGISEASQEMQDTIIS